MATVIRNAKTSIVVDTDVLDIARHVALKAIGKSSDKGEVQYQGKRYRWITLRQFQKNKGFTRNGREWQIETRKRYEEMLRLAKESSDGK